MEKPHRKLDVWNESITLVKLVYELTKSFPKNEEYGISSQIRRAAVSIPGNIAEGAARKSLKEFIRFLHIARGSMSELDTYIEIGKQLGYIRQESFEQVDRKMISVDRMLAGLINYLKKSC
jgi:four helix bundle protein